MNYKKDDKINKEIKKLLKEEIDSIDESLMFKKADKAISLILTKKQK